MVAGRLGTRDLVFLDRLGPNEAARIAPGPDKGRLFLRFNLDLRLIQKNAYAHLLGNLQRGLRFGTARQIPHSELAYRNSGCLRVISGVARIRGGYRRSGSR